MGEPVASDTNSAPHNPPPCSFSKSLSCLIDNTAKARLSAEKEMAPLTQQLSVATTESSDQPRKTQRGSTWPSVLGNDVEKLGAFASRQRRPRKLARAAVTCLISSLAVVALMASCYNTLSKPIASRKVRKRRLSFQGRRSPFDPFQSLIVDKCLELQQEMKYEPEPSSIYHNKGEALSHILRSVKEYEEDNLRQVEQPPVSFVSVSLPGGDNRLSPTPFSAMRDSRVPRPLQGEGPQLLAHIDDPLPSAEAASSVGEEAAEFADFSASGSPPLATRQDLSRDSFEGSVSARQLPSTSSSHSSQPQIVSVLMSDPRGQGPPPSYRPHYQMQRSPYMYTRPQGKPGSAARFGPLILQRLPNGKMVKIRSLTRSPSDPRKGNTK